METLKLYQGLFFDYFSVPKLEIKQIREKPQFTGPFTDTMMAKCATVDDVLEMLSKYYVKWNPKIQMFVVDRTGDSAIVEGETVVRNSDAFQVVTNFRLSRIPEDQKPCEWPAWSCSRHKKAEQMLLETSHTYRGPFSRYFKGDTSKLVQFDRNDAV